MTGSVAVSKDGMQYRFVIPGTRAFSVPIESERGSISCFDAFSSREPVSTSLENALVRLNRQQMVQPLLHGLVEVVVRPAKPSIAAGNDLILLVLQGAAGARTVARGFTDHLGIHRVDLAIEIGQLRIGADRLL